MRQRFFLIFFGVVFSLIAGEVLIRILISFHLIKYPDPQFDKIVHQYSKNLDLVYELKPNAFGFDGVLDIHTNSLGMKDKEYPMQKPAGSYRIGFVGDSVTFGPGIKLEDLASEILESRLNQIGDHPYEVMNFGVIGYNSWQEEVVVRKKVLPTNPDAILVGYCLNDDTHTDGLGDLARQMHPDSIGPQLHSKFISFIMHRLERATFRLFKTSHGAEALFDTLAKVQKENGTKVAVVIYPYRFESLEDYKELWKHKNIRTLAEERGLKVLDFLDITKEMSKEQRWPLYQRAEDKVHFSPEGMKVIGDWLFENRGAFVR